MKKIIFSLFVVALAAISCADKNQTTIEVLVQGIEDSARVSFYEDRRGQNALTTVTVQKNGKVTFSETANPELIRFIGVEGKGGAPIPVVMEAGKIILNIGETTTVKGSPLNVSNMKLGQTIAENPDEETKLVKEFIQINSDNILGVFYLNRYAFAYSLDELKEMLALFTAKYDNNETLNLVKENVKIQEETAIGKSFKDLKGLNPEGQEISLSDYAGKGKVVLVDFWASWCPPCRRDMPHLVEAYAKYKDKGFEIVGVSLDKTQEDWVKGISELNITWPQMSDLNYWNSEHAKQYAVRSIPFTVLIDGNGTIIEKKITGEELNAKLSELLK